ncbi:unnamed protein product [Rotaria socialis]|uniref:Endonuclease/exonuclease/phosphatase domain-containing protein n=1 Tax=Rotaria socialis TaxID=392032 RepID=A0A821U8A4_9BILA|nr:unnamed protein product [Rotaria socialis]CAF4885671.1 unnamed protein product [Rotaria socialis]
MKIEKEDVEATKTIEQQNIQFQKILDVANQLIQQQNHMLEQFTKVVNETSSIVQNVVHSQDETKNSNGHKEIINSLIQTCQSSLEQFKILNQQHNLKYFQIISQMMNCRNDENNMTQNAIIHDGGLWKSPNYIWLTPPSTNYLGGVAILYHRSLKCMVAAKELNFLMIEMGLNPDPIPVGVVYIPSGSLPPFHLFAKCSNNPLFIFGDFNAKHIRWNCATNNMNGNHLVSWLEKIGNEIIIRSKPTSSRSTGVIDFGITHDTNDWKSEVLD